jgi:hypothetical protein
VEEEKSGGKEKVGTDSRGCCTEQEDIEQSQVVEMAAPTYESKRKQQAGGPKSKRRKLEPLLNWGKDAENDILEELLEKKSKLAETGTKSGLMPRMRMCQAAN